MPRLRKHKTKRGYYILTRIGNQIITFQVTGEGWKRLRTAGIDADQRFGRSLLLDLYRSGEVFTHGTGPGQVFLDAEERQLEFDFSNDKEPETSIPSCSKCGSVGDLHLVTLESDNTATAAILCADCRLQNTIGVSIPLPLVDRALLTKLERIKNIHENDTTVDNYRDLLNRDFASKWEEIRKQNASHQGYLGLTDESGLNL